jgi:hypothetical protein
MYSTSCELSLLMKLFRLIRVCLNETVKFCIVRCLCDAFPIQNAVKRGGALSSLILNIVVGCAVSKVQEITEGLQLNGTHQLVVCTYDDNLVGRHRGFIRS